VADNIVSDKLIAAYALSAGFVADDAVTAVAIALAESRGNANAHNRNLFIRADAYGLWQINMFGELEKKRLTEFGIVIKEQLFDPVINAKAAYKVFQSSGFKAWQVWTTGSYRMFMSRAKTAVDGAGNIVVGGTPGATTSTQVGGKVGDLLDALNPLNMLQNFAKWLMDQLKPFVLRLAAFIGGGVMIILAIILFVRKSAMA